jgi:putative transposon-encoded protein
MTKKSTLVEVMMKIKTAEVRRGKVTKFGTGGAHITFSNKYIGKEVIIIPVENNGKRKNKNLERE